MRHTTIVGPPLDAGVSYFFLYSHEQHLVYYRDTILTPRLAMSMACVSTWMRSASENNLKLKFSHFAGVWRGKTSGSTLVAGPDTRQYLRDSFEEIRKFSNGKILAYININFSPHLLWTNSLYSIMINYSWNYHSLLCILVNHLRWLFRSFNYFSCINLVCN